MYYLVVKNLGVERCIHHSEEDIYVEGMDLSCLPGLAFPGGELVREIRIRCIETPGTSLAAKVFRDRIYP